MKRTGFNIKIYKDHTQTTFEGLTLWERIRLAFAVIREIKIEFWGKVKIIDENKTNTLINKSK